MAESFKTIIAAVDFSDVSFEAWRVACRIAHLTGGELHLVHVCADPLRETWAVETFGVDLAAIEKAWREEAERRLAAIQPSEPIPADRITRTVLGGSPRTTIVEYARAQQADLIVMGTHGYGPVKHLLLGSVAEGVVRTAHCPVLTVPERAVSDQSVAPAVA